MHNLLSLKDGGEGGQFLLLTDVRGLVMLS